MLWLEYLRKPAVRAKEFEPREDLSYLMGEGKGISLEGGCVGDSEIEVL